MLKITSREKAAASAETLTYDVQNLIDAGHDPDELIGAIIDCVEPQSWQGNGGEGTLRINFSKSRVQPYIFGGGGFTHYQVTNTNTNLSAIRSGDNVATVPTGAGLSLRLAKEFLIDLRGTYRFAFNDNLLNTASADIGGGVPGLDSWNLAAKMGFEF